MDSAKQKSPRACKPPKTPFNEDSYWKIWNLIRNNYQRIAYDAYISNNTDKAILYDSKALSCGFIGEMKNNDRLQNMVNQKSILKTVNMPQKSDHKIMGFFSAELANLSINETICDVADDQTQFNELCAKCARLPPQWNVIQLSQMFDGYKGYNATKDMYTSDAPIKITLFRDSLSGVRQSQPISIVLDLSEFNEKTILSTAYEINHVMYKNYSSKMTEAGFQLFMQRLTQLQTQVIDDMSSWLGPWIALLCGKIKGKNGEKVEQDIFKQVKQFCDEHDSFTKDQCVLLSLMARRIDLLDADKIEHGSQDIGQTPNQCNQIVKFLTKLKKNIKLNGFEYYPSILVVDEILDSLPWEMVLKSQQCTRVHSMHLLFDLYKKFKDQIDDGYLKMNLKSGFALVNPDNDAKLGDMVKRLGEYYENCFPQWQLSSCTVPTFDQISQALTKNDLFIYSGHGSSLQFFSSAEFAELKYNRIMMLFGCDSIAMKSSGTICEADCSAYTYFTSGCPGVLGANTIVTDIWIDVITIYLLTQWTAAKQAKHPIIEVSRDDVTRNLVNRILKKIKGKRNPNLLDLLCNVREEKEINIRNRSAIVYRGLPPYNTAME